VTEKQLREPVPGAQQIAARVLARADKIASGFSVAIRDA
jgi:hypothetical protein